MLREDWQGYHRQKYAAMLREAFESFEQFTATHVRFLIRSIQTSQTTYPAHNLRSSSRNSPTLFARELAKLNVRPAATILPG